MTTSPRPTAKQSHCSRGAKACQRCSHLFIAALLACAGRQQEAQQVLLVTLQIETSELAAAESAALAEALQIERQQLLILAEAVQREFAAARLQADMGQPQATRRMAVGQRLQQGRKSAAALRVQRLQVIGQALQLAVLGFLLGQLRRQARVQHRLAVVGLDDGESSLRLRGLLRRQGCGLACSMQLPALPGAMDDQQNRDQQAARQQMPRLRPAATTTFALVEVDVLHQLASWRRAAPTAPIQKAWSDSSSSAAAWPGNSSRRSSRCRFTASPLESAWKVRSPSCFMGSNITRLI